MTKKELKALEEEKKKNQQEKINLRYEFLRQLHSWWDDVDATERYCKINNIEDKLTGYSPRLISEEKERLFNRYDILKELVDYNSNRQWDIVYAINETNKYYKGDYMVGYYNAKLEKDLDEQTLMIKDIIWEQIQFDKTIELARKLGYTKILYIDNSSACMENMVRFAKIGCQIIGTNAKMSHRVFDDEYEIDKEGVVLSIPEE